MVFTLPCGDFQNLIVAGGQAFKKVSSTEVLTYKTGERWRRVEELPGPRATFGVTLVNLDNRIFMFGGHLDGYLDVIFEFKDNGWVDVGKMKNKRQDHAVSIVNYHDFCS